MTEYPPTDFIRKGQEFMKTGVLSEAVTPGTVINIPDMSQYDVDDQHLGIAINTLDFDVAHGSNLPTDEPIYYIDIAEAKGAEVKMTEANAGAIIDGDLCQVTTAGKVITFAYTDGTEETDLMRDVIGPTIGGISQNSTGWVKIK